MRAAGYIRVSTEEQVRDGYGLAAQEQAVRAYCQAQQWELVNIYSDAGRSGKAMKGRDGLARLLEDARARQFERVVFWKMDRLARNLRDLLEMCERLEENGVGIASIQESIDTGTPTGRMMRNMLGSIAEFERETIVERIKAGLGEKARQGGLLGPLPLGYQREESGEIVLDPVVAPLIKALFERYATGKYSLRELVPWAASVGLRSTKGNPLDRLSIRKILSTVSYTGQVAYRARSGGGVVARGKQPVIVDAGLYATVQEVLARRRLHDGPTHPYGREPYPLSGVALCSSCGAPLLGFQTVVEQKYRYRHMRCSTAQRQGKEACPQPMVKAEVLEEQIGWYVGGMKLPVEYLGEVIAELRRRRQEPSDPGEPERLRRELKRWQRLFVLGEIEEASYRRETAPIKRRLVEIDKPTEVLDVERAVNCLRNMGELWSQSPRQQQREFVREVFDRITVQGRQVAAITPKPLYAPLFVVDRRERFGGIFCSIAPRAGVQPTTECLRLVGIQWVTSRLTGGRRAPSQSRRSDLDVLAAPAVRQLNAT